MLVSTAEGQNQETSSAEIIVGESRFVIGDFGGVAVIHIIEGTPIDMIYNPDGEPARQMMDDMLAQIESERDFEEQQVNGWMS